MANPKVKIFLFLRGLKSLIKNALFNDKNLIKFYQDLDDFQKLDTDNRLPLSRTEISPYLYENTSTTVFDAHYVYHPAWAARIVKTTSPEKHVDISSTLHFCSILSAFIPTDFYDYRPVDLKLTNLNCKHANLTDLHFKSRSIASLSCLHTIEHIGLGRYGDSLDPEGDLKAISELMRVCAPQGNLLIAVPVGKKKIVFNAHRIYDAEEFAGYFENFELLSFSLITDSSELIDDASYQQALSQNYGCGCYWFKKIA